MIENSVKIAKTSSNMGLSHTPSVKLQGLSPTEAVIFRLEFLKNLPKPKHSFYQSSILSI
jgi:hypothetical protein